MFAIEDHKSVHKRPTATEERARWSSENRARLLMHFWISMFANCFKDLVAFILLVFQFILLVFQFILTAIRSQVRSGQPMLRMRSSPFAVLVTLDWMVSASPSGDVQNCGSVFAHSSSHPRVEHIHRVSDTTDAGWGGSALHSGDTWGRAAFRYH